MVEEVTPDELKRKLDGGEDVQIVDIRTEQEFDDGHIPGAENIPFPELANNLERDWKDDIVVVCPIGQSSLQAARLLESYEGIGSDKRVANMVGGYEEWDFELETS